MIGFLGMAFAVAEDTSNLVKVPLIIIFVIIIMFGLAYEMFPQNIKDDVYGEVKSGGLR